MERRLIERYAAAATDLELDAAVLRGGRREYLSFSGGQLSCAPHGGFFEICSITKTFTGTLLAGFLGRGELSLDERVSDRLEGLPAGYYYPTVRELATHTGGYGELIPWSEEQRQRLGDCISADPAEENPFRRLTRRDLVSFAATARLAGGPYPSVYSNLGVALLGELMARADGRSPTELLEDFIKNTLSLGGFSLGRPEGAVFGVDMAGRRRESWRWEKDNPFILMGGLYSGAPALMDYAEALLSGRAPFGRLAFEPLTESFHPGCSSGLCWFVRRDGVVWHNGGTGCFKTWFGLDPASGTAAAVLSNQKARGGITPEMIGEALLAQED